MATLGFLRYLVLIMVALSWSMSEAQGLRRGINVNPWFTKPQRAKDGTFVYPPFPEMNAQSFRLELLKLKAIGFDFIRLPVTTEPLMGYSLERKEKVLQNIGEVVKVALDVGLNVVFDPHIVTGGGATLSDLYKSDDATYKYLELVSQATKLIAGIDPTQVYIETMNEPNIGDCDDPKWQPFQRKIVDAIRQEEVRSKIIISGPCLSSVQGTLRLNLDDWKEKSNIYVTFHYYTPFWFTHQGATWTGDAGSKILTGVVWPPSYGSYEQTLKATIAAAPKNMAYRMYGEKSLARAKDIIKRYYQWSPDEKYISADFDKIEKWASEQGVPADHILLGEFGVLKVERNWNGADLDSAARWLKVVRVNAEARGFSWSMWSYKEGMAITIDENGSQYYPEIVRALGMTP